jgi:hypothetical protein
VLCADQSATAPFGSLLRQPTVQRAGGDLFRLDELFGKSLGPGGVDAHPVALLCPDRYVFGVVGETHGLDALLAELGQRLALR